MILSGLSSIIISFPQKQSYFMALRSEHLPIFNRSFGPAKGPSTGDALGKVSHLLRPGHKGYGYSPPATSERRKVTGNIPKPPKMNQRLPAPEKRTVLCSVLFLFILYTWMILSLQPSASPYSAIK